MDEKPIAIVLGGTHPHISLINNLKARGYRTVLVDYAKTPIAKEFADEHILESTLDKEKVLKVARDINAELVITTCSDQANVTACYVAEELHLPAPYSYDVALSVTDKELMKKTMFDAGIPTSSFISLDRDFEIEDVASLHFPVIVKPSDCYGSKAVRVASDYIELENNVRDAIAVSRNGKAIVEEFLVGEEIGIDCFVTRGIAKIVMTKHRRKILNTSNEIQQIYGCTWPAVLTEEVEKQAERIANEIAKVFKLENTPLMIQAIVKDNELYVIEFGARIGGGNSFNIIKRYRDFDIIDASIDSFLGIKTDLKLQEGSSFYADLFLYMESAEFSHVGNIERLRSENIIIDFIGTKKKGVLIGDDLASRNRVGSLIFKCETLDGLFEKMEEAIDIVEIFDVNHEPKMRKELYPF